MSMFLRYRHVVAGLIIGLFLSACGDSAVTSVADAETTIVGVWASQSNSAHVMWFMEDGRHFETKSSGRIVLGAYELSERQGQLALNIQSIGGAGIGGSLRLSRDEFCMPLAGCFDRISADQAPQLSDELLAAPKPINGRPPPPDFTALALASDPTEIPTQVPVATDAPTEAPTEAPTTPPAANEAPAEEEPVTSVDVAQELIVGAWQDVTIAAHLIWFLPDGSFYETKSSGRVAPGRYSLSQGEDKVLIEMRSDTGSTISGSILLVSQGLCLPPFSCFSRIPDEEAPTPPIESAAVPTLAVPTIVPTSAPSPVPDEEYSFPGDAGQIMLRVVQTSDGFAAIRAEPNTQSRELGRLPSGTEVACWGYSSGQSLEFGGERSDQWAYCDLPGPEGYIFGLLLEPLE